MHVLRHSFNEMALTLIARHAREMLSHYDDLCDSADSEYLQMIQRYGDILVRFRKETSAFLDEMRKYHKDLIAHHNVH